MGALSESIQEVRLPGNGLLFIALLDFAKKISLCDLGRKRIVEILKFRGGNGMMKGKDDKQKSRRFKVSRHSIKPKLIHRRFPLVNPRVFGKRKEPQIVERRK